MSHLSSKSVLPQAQGLGFSCSWLQPGSYHNASFSEGNQQVHVKLIKKTTEQREEGNKILANKGASHSQSTVQPRIENTIFTVVTVKLT